MRNRIIAAAAVLLLILSPGLFAADSFCGITVLYDNYVAAQGTKANWGFSCIIRGLDRTILLDAGAKTDVLLDNMKALGTDPAEPDVFVLSHMHDDHLGGLSGFLELNKGMTAYIPDQFPRSFETDIVKGRAETVRTAGPRRIAEGAYVTGGTGFWTVEQALVLDAPPGLVVITGCAHPGVVEMVKKAREISGREVYLLLGGFHLLGCTEDQVNAVIKELKGLGVKRCGATHCTGDNAIRLFKEAFGADYVQVGTGLTISIPK